MGREEQSPVPHTRSRPLPTPRRPPPTRSRMVPTRLLPPPTATRHHPPTTNQRRRMGAPRHWPRPPTCTPRMGAALPPQHTAAAATRRRPPALTAAPPLHTVKPRRLSPPRIIRRMGRPRHLRRRATLRHLARTRGAYRRRPRMGRPLRRPTRRPLATNSTAPRRGPRPQATQRSLPHRGPAHTPPPSSTIRRPTARRRPRATCSRPPSMAPAAMAAALSSRPMGLPPRLLAMGRPPASTPAPRQRPRGMARQQPIRRPRVTPRLLTPRILRPIKVRINEPPSAPLSSWSHVTRQPQFRRRGPVYGWLFGREAPHGTHMSMDPAEMGGCTSVTCFMSCFSAAVGLRSVGMARS